MNSSELRRRDLLFAVSCGCVAFAGCTDTEPAAALAGATKSAHSGYGGAYGDGYGTE
ncbi:hypothetical protein [Haloterrigena salinisoli]|uniref:hypothetical protein n=1 Tax=Haloterrigena salinisoli TaxID=3132747 RepID=UPI0030D02AA9